jgi:hypothetical protein
MDYYSRFILTIIAICLVGICFNDFINEEAHASFGAQVTQVEVTNSKPIPVALYVLTKGALDVYNGRWVPVTGEGYKLYSSSNNDDAAKIYMTDDE